MKKLIILLATFVLVACGGPDEKIKLKNSTDEIYRDDHHVTRYHLYTHINQECIKEPFFIDGLTVKSVEYIVHPRWIHHTFITYSNGDFMIIQPKNWKGTGTLRRYCPDCYAPADADIINIYDYDLTAAKENLVNCLKEK